jgi:hypothetical protein
VSSSRFSGTRQQSCGFILPTMAIISSVLAISKFILVVQCGAPVIELHTGHYADTTGAEQQAEFERIKNMATYAQRRCKVILSAPDFSHNNAPATGDG